MSNYSSIYSSIEAGMSAVSGSSCGEPFQDAVRRYNSWASSQHYPTTVTVTTDSTTTYIAPPAQTSPEITELHLSDSIGYTLHTQECSCSREVKDLKIEVELLKKEIAELKSFRGNGKGIEEPTTRLISL